MGRATFLETFAGTIAAEDIVAHCEKEHAPEVYGDWLGKPDVHIWIAATREGDTPVGYVVLTRAALPVKDPRPGDWEIKRIYLLHRFHGTGVGPRLMQSALEGARMADAKRVLLGVYAQNTRAIAFYRKLGFTQVGERQFQVGARSYLDQVLALTMGAGQSRPIA